MKHIFISLAQLRVVILTFLWNQSVLCGDYFRSNYVKNLESCSLVDFSSQNVTESEVRCKFACLQKKCAAYQWDAASGNCQMQDKLNITTSSSNEDTVGLMMGDEDLPVTCAADCADILARDPTSESGVYSITVGGQVLKQVWCDMDTGKGEWTVFLKRFDGSVDFYLDYTDYQDGFGDVSGEFWIRLDALRAITTSKTYQVRADVEDWADASVHSLHSSLLVADESDCYRLTVGTFIESEGEGALSNGDSMQFTTRDRDRDVHSSVNCAQNNNGAYWYRKCQRCNPMGVYYSGGAYSGSKNNGIEWKSLKAHKDNYYSMKTLALKLRP